MKKKESKNKDEFIRKIERLYQNYGIDTSNMDEDEFERLRSSYQARGKNIDHDLEKSEKYKNQFEDDIV